MNMTQEDSTRSSILNAAISSLPAVKTTKIMTTNMTNKNKIVPTLFSVVMAFFPMYSTCCPDYADGHQNFKTSFYYQYQQLAKYHNNVHQGSKCEYPAKKYH